MSMRINTLVTHLGAQDAYTLIEFINQWRDILMKTYADEITAMLQEASQPSHPWDDDDNNQAL